MQSSPQTKHSHPQQSTRKCIQAQDTTTAKTLQPLALNITQHVFDNFTLTLLFLSLDESIHLWQLTRNMENIDFFITFVQNVIVSQPIALNSERETCSWTAILSSVRMA